MRHSSIQIKYRVLNFAHSTTRSSLAKVNHSDALSSSPVLITHSLPYNGTSSRATTGSGRIAARDPVRGVTGQSLKKTHLKQVLIVCVHCVQNQRLSVSFI